MFKELLSDDLSLLSIKKVDPSELCQLANNKKIWLNMRDIFPHPYTMKDAEFFLNMDTRKNMRWAIHSNGLFVGLMGLHENKDVYRHSLEIGYWIGEPFWGKGFATKALKMVTDYAFTLPEIKRIYAGVFSTNPASARVLEKVGFVEEGKFSKSVLKDGTYLDEYRFGLLKPEI